METHFIYTITNQVNGKVYVGLTKNPDQRWEQHKNTSYLRSRNEALYRAMRKHGRKNFVFEVIEELESLEAANEAEQKWIANLGTMDPKVGYNMTSGGKVYEVNEEMKKKRELVALIRWQKSDQEDKDRRLGFY